MHAPNDLALKYVTLKLTQRQGETGKTHSGSETFDHILSHSLTAKKKRITRDTEDLKGMSTKLT